MTFAPLSPARLDETVALGQLILEKDNVLRLDP